LWRVCCHRGVFDVCRLFLTPTCRVSGYPWQVIKVDASLPTTLYLIHSANNCYNTYNRYTTRHLYSSSWYLLLRRCDPLVHLSPLMTAVCLSLLLTKLRHWFCCLHWRLFATDCCSTLTAVQHFIVSCWTLTLHCCLLDTVFLSRLSSFQDWLLFTKCSSFYSPGPYSIEDTISNCLVVTQRVWLL
jgi:hypothetical protein